MPDRNASRGHSAPRTAGPSLARFAQKLSRSLYVDLGEPGATTFVAGMGRSGTTLVAAVINHDFSYRIIFEPFRPHVVPAAVAFGAYAYVRPSDRDPVRRAAVESILAGRTPRGTLDRQHRGRVFRRRIVKEVRCNLMLGWLKAVRPSMPMVLVVRNPFAVAASWVRLGWGMVAGGHEAELDVILGHEALHEDFPEIRRIIATIDCSDPAERAVLQWSLLHYVPRRQLRMGDVHLLAYERLLLEPNATVDALAGYLRERIEGPTRDRALREMTSTDFLHRGEGVDSATLLGDWKEVLSPRQVERGRGILEAFGLGAWYDADGLPAEMRLEGTPSHG